MPQTTLIFINHGQAFTTSLVVAEKFGKKHKNVLQAVCKLDCSEEFRRLNFQPTFYDVPGPKSSIRQENMFNITRDGFAFLAMGFTGKEAARWKEQFIDASTKWKR